MVSAILEDKKVQHVVFYLCVCAFFLISGFLIGMWVVGGEINTIQNVVATSSATPQNPSKKIQEKDDQQKGDTYFYGYVLDRKDQYILVQQILAKDMYGATAFRVFAGERTQFTHLQPNENKSWASLPQEPGALSAVKKGMFVYVSTEDPLITTPAIRATSIVYTEVSPFPQEIQKK